VADQAYVDLLEQARELLQHSLPGRDFVEIQRRALQALVKKLRARKCAATDRARAPEPSSPDPVVSEPMHPERQERAAPGRRRHIPAAVRHTVWQRDAARCTHRDARGQRCRERGGLEIHHLAPHARGGPATVDNLTLRCRAHNALAAEQDFGRHWMMQKKNAHRAGAERKQR
jgi:5-methylcytosine-specific restriction endonuclease McrA